jgi:hypothetical protein
VRGQHEGVLKLIMVWFGGISVETQQCTLYKAFGLTISSEIEFPELIGLDTLKPSVDISIEYRDLLKYWNDNANKDYFCLVEEQSVWIHVPDTAIFCIEKGKKILVSPIKSNQDAKIRLYILGTCMGALLLQRRVIPLHGSAIAINNRAYGIVGESGAGKSTLAASFLEKGFTLLSDDIIPISLINGIPMVTPAYPQQKLWKESLDAFSVSSDQFSAIFDRETKYIVPVPASFELNQMPLEAVFELIKGEDEIILRPLNKLEQLRKLYEHTFRSFLIERLNLLEWHFHITAAISNKVKMYQLTRPTSRFSAEELSDLILRTVHKE